MKVKILTEGSRPNEIGYHFTSIDSLVEMLKSNEILATNEPLQNKQIKRCTVMFPDKSKINLNCFTKDDDGTIIIQYPEGMSSAQIKRLLPKLDNNVLKDKIQQFNGEFKVYSYDYTPFKDILGKKSWSYTRRPEGMSYRNMKTFDNESVRIAIDIDKLTEKGNKIVPFSWLNQPKSDRYNEYEERVFPRNGKFTPNLSQFITEIAVRYELVLSTTFTRKGINLEKEIHSYLRTVRKLLLSIPAYELYAKKVLKIINTDLSKKEKIENLKKLDNAVNKNFYNEYSRYLNLEKEIEERIHQLITEIDDEDHYYLDSVKEYIEKNPKIKLIYVDAKGKPRKNNDIKTLIQSKIENYIKSTISENFGKEILKKELTEIYNKVYDFMLKNKKDLF